jgi:hypothetical protein
MNVAPYHVLKHTVLKLELLPLLEINKSLFLQGQVIWGRD